MKAFLFTREEYAGPEEKEEIVISSFVDAVRVCRYMEAAGVHEVVIRAGLPDGRILKADPEGYWIACTHGRHACDVCGTGDMTQFGPRVAGSEYVSVP